MGFETRNRALWAGLLLAACGIPAAADTLVVPSTAYPTIQAALDAVQVGDEVVLAAGTYTGAGNEALVAPGVAFTLRGETGDPADVVLQGPIDPYERIVHAITFAAGDSGTSVEDLTIAGFTGLAGAAVRITGADLTFDNCVFFQNATGSIDCFQDGYGGALHIRDSATRLVDCVLRGNFATGTACAGFGGASGGGGVYAERSALTFERCLLEGNRSWSEADSPSRGGAISAAGSTVNLVDSILRDNDALGGVARGGAVSASVVIARGTDFIDNNIGWTVEGAEHHGGAIAAATVVAVGCDFIENRNFSDGTAVGGAISGTDVTVVSGSMIANDVGGGGTLEARGGAVSASSSLEMVNVVVAGNTAVQGAPGTQALGGAVHAGGGATLDHVTLAGNEASIGRAISADAGPIVLRNCVVDNGTDWLSASAPATVAWSCVVGGYPGEGNIDAHPMLDTELRPLAGSPVIDAGNTTLLPADTYDLDGDGDTSEPLPLDLAGLARAVDDPATPDTGVGSPGVGVVDMGAYEVQSVCRADLDGDGELTLFDFLAFQNAFDAGDPVADFDGDGELTLFDFLAFQNEFDAGCP